MFMSKYFLPPVMFMPSSYVGTCCYSDDEHELRSVDGVGCWVHILNEGGLDGDVLSISTLQESAGEHHNEEYDESDRQHC